MGRRRPKDNKRALSPGAELSPPTRPRTIRPQDPRVVQTTQSFGSMSLVATSPGPSQFQSLPRPPGRTRGNVPNIHPGRGQYPSGPTLPAPDYGNFPYISPGQNPYQSRPPLGPPMYRSDPSILPDLLSVAELRTLWDAAGTNPQTDFHRIKHDLFQNRYDLTPEMLKEACWTEEEDTMLRDTDITPTSDPAYLEFVAGLLKGLKETDPNARFFRLRSIATYRARIAYLDNIRYGWQNMGNPPAGAPPPPMLHPGLPAPGTYTASSGSASRGPVGGSMWPAQHRGVPPPMPGAILNQQQQPGYTPSVGRSNFSFDEYECPDPQSYLDDESEDYVGPYESPGAFLGGSSSGGSDPGASPLPSPGGQSDGPLGRQEHGGDLAGYRRLLPFGDNPPVTRGEEAWARTLDRTQRSRRTRGPSKHPRPTLSIEQQEQFRVKAAQGFSIPAICEKYFKGLNLTEWAIGSAMYRTGWKAWSRPQDDELLHLHDIWGDDWAAISSELNEVPRWPIEVEARVKYHKDDDGNLHDESNVHGRHKYTFQDDLEIMGGYARGLPISRIAAKIRNVKPNSIENRARRIGARWREQDDIRLADLVRQGGTNVNWDAIAREFNPRCTAEICQIRWEYLQLRDQRY